MCKIRAAVQKELQMNPSIDPESGTAVENPFEIVMKVLHRTPSGHSPNKRAACMMQNAHKRFTMNSHIAHIARHLLLQRFYCNEGEMRSILLTICHAL